MSEERKLRNISDYIFDCTSRLFEHAELLAYLSKHKEDFRDEASKNSAAFIISIIDLYSKDAIIIIGSVLDEDRQTSSLYSLVDYLEGNPKNKYLKRLKAIKKSLNPIVRLRGNQAAHFNTKLNVYENGNSHINGIFQFDPLYLKRVTKRIEGFYWDIKEELGIEGLYMFRKGEPIVKSFVRLIRGNENGKR